jgi:hypothetical protein
MFDVYKEENEDFIKYVLGNVITQYNDMAYELMSFFK